MDAGGLALTDSAGTLGVVVADGGRVGVGGAAEATRQLAVKSTGQATMLMQTMDDTAQSFAAAVVAANGLDVTAEVIAHDTLRSVARWGLAALGGWVEMRAGGAAAAGLVVGTGNAAPLVLGTNNAERARISAEGRLGVGTSAPRGLVHGCDGLASVLLWSNGAVAGSAVTIVPDGTGDVTSRAVFFYVCDNAGVSVAGLGNVVTGGNQDVVAGGGTWRFAVSAAGALTVVRSAGTGTGKVAVLALWI